MAGSKKKFDHREEPTYWFAILEIARESGDYQLAAEADRELKRLGVRVKFTRRVPAGNGGSR